MITPTDLYNQPEQAADEDAIESWNIVCLTTTGKIRTVNPDLISGYSDVWNSIDNMLKKEFKTDWE